MKNVSMMVVGLLIAGLSLLIVMTIGGYMNRRVELQEDLSTAMERTAEQMAEKGRSGMAEEAARREAMAECMETLSENTQTDMGLGIAVYGIDAGKGLLAMKAEERFDHPNGQEATTEWERMVICDPTVTEESKSHQVRFFRCKADLMGDGNCYKSYTVQEGAQPLTPAAPKAEGAEFVCWVDAYGYVADFSQPVEEDRSYYAEWVWH